MIRAPRSRRRGVGLLLGVLVLVLGELGFHLHPPPRLADIPPANDSPDTLMRGSPWLLWDLVPGAHFEQGGHVTVNAAGFRDRNRGPKTRPRLLALGDSSVYGFGVDDAEVFTAHLEADLGVEVINGGVPGYSSFQSINLLRGRGLAFDPDVLLVGNLWSDNNFDSFVDRELLADYAGWIESPASRLRHRLQASALFRGLDWHLRVSRQINAAQTVGWQAGSTAPRTGKRRVSILDYATNLTHFCAIMHARDGGVVFLMLPNREDISGRAPSPAWGPYRRAMREVAKACGAPLVDGPRAFTASGRSADVLFRDQMHPTAAGHTLLAAAVAATLSTENWPATPLLVRDRPATLVVPPDPFENTGATSEHADVRPARLRLRLTLPPHSLPGTLAVHDADAPESPDPLGSALLPEGADTSGQTEVEVHLSQLPGRVRVELDRPGHARKTGVAAVTDGQATVELK